MALIDHKLINLSNPVSSLPDHPSAEGMTAQIIKDAFDKSPNEIKNKINALIDNLLAKTANDSGADNIGSTSIQGVAGETVRAQLISLKTLYDQMVLGQIQDNTITNAKLAPAIKIGDLANLITVVKSDLVAAVNEVKEQNNSLAAKVIAESGSNANGNYIKFEDGTMICSASLLLSDVEHTIASGSIFMNSEVIWTYPASFISSASVSGSCTNLAYGKGWLSFFATNSTTQAKYSIMSSMSGTTPSVRVSLIAIGRWK